MSNVNQGAFLQRQAQVIADTKKVLTIYKNTGKLIVIPEEFYLFVKENKSMPRLTSKKLESARVNLRKLVIEIGLEYQKQKLDTDTNDKLHKLWDDANLVFSDEVDSTSLLEGIGERQGIAYSDVLGFINRAVGGKEQFYKLIASGHLSPEKFPIISQVKLKDYFSNEYAKLCDARSSISNVTLTGETEFIYSFRVKPGVWFFGRTKNIQDNLLSHKSDGLVNNYIEVKIYETDVAEKVEKTILSELKRVNAIKCEGSQNQYEIPSSLAIALWNYVRELSSK